MLLIPLNLAALSPNSQLITRLSRIIARLGPCLAPTPALKLSQHEPFYPPRPKNAARLQLHSRFFRVDGRPAGSLADPRPRTQSFAHTSQLQALTLCACVRPQSEWDLPLETAKKEDEWLLSHVLLLLSGSPLVEKQSGPTSTINQFML